MGRFVGCLGVAAMLFMVVITAYTDPIAAWIMFITLCIVLFIVMIGAIADAIKRSHYDRS